MILHVKRIKNFFLANRFRKSLAAVEEKVDWDIDQALLSENYYIYIESNKNIIILFLLTYITMG